jgi:hypothetical protein
VFLWWQNIFTLKECILWCYTMLFWIHETWVIGILLFLLRNVVCLCIVLGYWLLFCCTMSLLRLFTLFERLIFVITKVKCLHLIKRLIFATIVSYMCKLGNIKCWTNVFRSISSYWKLQVYLEFSMFIFITCLCKFIPIIRFVEFFNEIDSMKYLFFFLW